MGPILTHYPLPTAQGCELSSSGAEVRLAVLEAQEEACPRGLCAGLGERVEGMAAQQVRRGDGAHVAGGEGGGDGRTAGEKGAEFQAQGEGGIIVVCGERDDVYALQRRASGHRGRAALLSCVGRGMTYMHCRGGPAGTGGGRHYCRVWGEG